MSVATTCPDGPTCSAIHAAIEPRPAATSRQRQPGWITARRARDGIVDLLEQAEALVFGRLPAGRREAVRGPALRGSPTASRVLRLRHDENLAWPSQTAQGARRHG